MKLNGMNLAKIIQMAKAKVASGVSKMTEAANGVAEGAVNDLVQAESAKKGTLTTMLGNPGISTQERMIIMEAINKSKEASKKGNQTPPAPKARENDGDETPSGNHTRPRLAA